jgi:NAD(P)-dependent dehydrogenase (short-subunit alcohol dehydrogenase family)
MLTDAIRMQLRSQRTQVAGVYAGYIDTDMSAHQKVRTDRAAFDAIFYAVGRIPVAELSDTTRDALLR